MAGDEATEIAVIERFLENAGGRVSEADVAAGAGVDLGTARRALQTLMRRFESVLDVHEDGTLVFDFGASLRRLDQPSWLERLGTVGSWLWRGFSWLYKASLAMVLVSYAVVFVVLIIGAAIAASAASEDSGPAEGAIHLVGAVFRGIFEFATHTALTYQSTDRYGYPHQHYEPKAPLLKRGPVAPHEKSFIASVYDFVLGPERVEPDPRAQKREVASFVREHGGTLTIADVQALSGMSRADAERFFSAFVAEFEGEAEITDDGVLYARFEELLGSSSTELDEPIIHFWDEYEPPHELTGNTTGKNIGIGLLAAFNLVCSIALLTQVPDLPLLGAVPAGIFSLFFAIPAIRAPFVWWRNRKQHLTNIKKRLFGALFSSEEERVPFGEAIEAANRRRADEELLDATALRPLLEETAAELGIEVDAGDADLVYDLGPLRRELEAQKQHAFEVDSSTVSFTTR